MLIIPNNSMGFLAQDTNNVSAAQYLIVLIDTMLHCISYNVVCFALAILLDKVNGVRLQ